MFNTDQSEYVGVLTEGAGIRVVVHNQTEFPFPEDDSIAVSPGTLTYIGASLVYLVTNRFLHSIISDGVKDMTHEAKAPKAMAMTHKAKAKDLTCHAALKPQTLYTVQC